MSVCRLFSLKPLSLASLHLRRRRVRHRRQTSFPLMSPSLDFSCLFSVSSLSSLCPSISISLGQASVPPLCVRRRHLHCRRRHRTGRGLVPSTLPNLPRRKMEVPTRHLFH